MVRIRGDHIDVAGTTYRRDAILQATKRRRTQILVQPIGTMYMKVILMLVDCFVDIFDWLNRGRRTRSVRIRWVCVPALMMVVGHRRRRISQLQLGIRRYSYCCRCCIQETCNHRAISAGLDDGGWIEVMMMMAVSIARIREVMVVDCTLVRQY